MYLLVTARGGLRDGLVFLQLAPEGLEYSNGQDSVDAKNLRRLKSSYFLDSRHKKRRYQASFFVQLVEPGGGESNQAMR